MRVRAELRSRWRSVVLLAVLVALGDGTALTALAGARRTDAAMGQFVAYSLPDDGGFLSGSFASPPVSPGPPDSLAPDPVARAVLSLPMVASWARAPFLYLTADPAGPSAMTAIGVPDAAFLRTQDRPLLLAGRLPSPEAPWAATVNEFAAQARHLHIGSRVRLYAFSWNQVQGLNGGVPLGHQAPQGPTFTVRVAAIVRSPQEVNAVRPLAASQGVTFEAQQTIYLTGAFLQRYAAGIGVPVTGLPDMDLYTLRLRHGPAEWPAFSRAASAIGGNQIFLSAGNTYSVHKAAASAQRGIGVAVVALLLFGSLLTVLTLVLVGQALARGVTVDAVDVFTLRALGVTTGQVVAIAALRALVIGAVGGAAAAVMAWLASPIMPIGLARQAEVHPGLAFDPLVLLIGAAGVATLVVPWAAVPAWHLSRLAAGSVDEHATEPRLGALSGALSYTWLPPSASVGIRFGLNRGPGRGGVVTAAFGGVVAVAALAASFTFANSLGSLEHTPRQQGWNWDVLVGNPSSFNDIEARAQRLLPQDRFVTGYSAIAILAGANQGNATVDGQLVNLLLAFDPLKGSVHPPIIAGHEPRARDQIVLASKTTAQLHKHIGQWVTAGGPGGQLIRLRIVGTMIAPSVGDLFTNGVGEGGWIYGPAVRAAIRQAAGGFSGSQGSTPPTVFNLLAVQFAPGTPTAAALSTLRRQFGPVVLRQIPSEDVVNLQSVDRLPLIVALLVVVLGLSTVGNTLVGMVRRRRRDIAVLKTVGFLRRQVAGAVAWQATTFSLVALVVGLPLGVAFGRWSWSIVAAGIGSASPPLVPVLSVALVAPASVFLVNAVAAAPGLAAARTAPAVAMRSE